MGKEGWLSLTAERLESAQEAAPSREQGHKWNQGPPCVKMQSLGELVDLCAKTLSPRVCAWAYRELASSCRDHCATKDVSRYVWPE